MALRTPRLKIVRRLGISLPGLTRKAPKAPRAGAQSRSNGQARRAPSVHRLRLEEKQKLRFHYGVSERQMRRYMEMARRRPGPVGDNLLELLERRLDSVVFRLGIAPTIRAARQLIVHGHVEVNARRLDRPGYLVHLADVIALSSATHGRAQGRSTSESDSSSRLPSYLARETDGTLTGRVTAMPMRSDVPFPVREALVVAYYAR